MPRSFAKQKKKSPPSNERARRKGCRYCKDAIQEIDYKNHTDLRTWMSDKGKIRSRRVTGFCRKHQSQVSVAIKRAREVALLPYVGN